MKRRATERKVTIATSTALLLLVAAVAMGDADAPPLLAAQALLLSERGRDLIVFNPGTLRRPPALLPRATSSRR